MEIRIGVQNNPREIVIESSDSTDKITKAVNAALTKGETLSLQDDKGRTVIIPAGVLAYVDIAASDIRKVGFGA
jgi:hypothetical protein